MYFHAAIYESKGECDPVVPLVKLLTRPSLYILEKATILVAKVLSSTGYIPIAPDANAEDVLSQHMAEFSDSLMITIKSINPSEGIEAPKVVYAVCAASCATARDAHCERGTLRCNLSLAPVPYGFARSPLVARLGRRLRVAA